jgi:hypothetical protein
MPELRSRARTNQASDNPDPNPINRQLHKPDYKNKLPNVPTRLRRRTERNRGSNKNAIGVGERRRGRKVVNEARPLKDDEEGGEDEEIRVLREGGGEKAMDDCDSGGAGGQSGNKGPGAEDEGSTAPLPEKVSFDSLISCFVFSFLNFCLDDGKAEGKGRKGKFDCEFCVFLFFYVRTYGLYRVR